MEAEEKKRRAEEERKQKLVSEWRRLRLFRSILFNYFLNIYRFI